MPRDMGQTSFSIAGNPFLPINDTSIAGSLIDLIYIASLPRTRIARRGVIQIKLLSLSDNQITDIVSDLVQVPNLSIFRPFSTIRRKFADSWAKLDYSRFFRHLLVHDGLPNVYLGMRKRGEKGGGFVQFGASENGRTPRIQKGRGNRRIRGFCTGSGMQSMHSIFVKLNSLYH